MQCEDATFEDAVRALLGVFEFEIGRTWKRFDFDVMEALFAKGLISNSIGKHGFVHRTEEGLARAKSLAQGMFCQR